MRSYCFVIETHLIDCELQVGKEFLTKAYRYGKSLVPFLKTDEANMKLQSEKGLKILCFVKSEKVRIFV